MVQGETDVIAIEQNGEDGGLKYNCDDDDS